MNEKTDKRIDGSIVNAPSQFTHDNTESGQQIIPRSQALINSTASFATALISFTASFITVWLTQPQSSLKPRSECDKWQRLAVRFVKPKSSLVGHYGRLLGHKSNFV